jgi:hypothetical protein
MAAHHSKAAEDKVEVGTRLSASTSVLKVRRQLKNFFYKNEILRSILLCKWVNTPQL